MTSFLTRFSQEKEVRQAVYVISTVCFIFLIPLIPSCSWVQYWNAQAIHTRRTDRQGYRGCQGADSTRGRRWPHNQVNKNTNHRRPSPKKNKGGSLPEKKPTLGRPSTRQLNDGPLVLPTPGEYKHRRHPGNGDRELSHSHACLDNWVYRVPGSLLSPSKYW